MAAHTKEQREFIVRRLAAFETPRDVAVAFGARFPDTRCTEQDVLATDPRIVIVAPDLWALFQAERKSVLGNPDAAPMAEKRARLIVLSRQVERYEANNQHTEARAVMKQIREEVEGPTGPGAGNGGGTGQAGGAPPITGIELIVVDPKELPPEQMP